MMVRGTLAAKLRHFCKCLVAEVRRHLIITSLICFCLLLLLCITFYGYGCDYVSPVRMPINLNSSQVNHFLIEEADRCHRRDNLDIIVYVHSSLDKVEKRQETRQTWATAGLYDPSVRMAVVFMVGRPKNRIQEAILREESQTHHDIVQGNYTDTYHMLTYKALSSINWVTRHCAHVPWTLHADDDVLIDIFLLKKFLENSATRDSLFCYPWGDSPVRRYGKWCVRRSEYPTDTYPEYCAGGAWVAATPLLRRLLVASGRVPVMWVDDVYLTGLVAQNASIPISKSLKESVRRTSIYKADLGTIIIWFEPGKSRKLWWYKILSYHKYVPPVDQAL